MTNTPDHTPTPDPTPDPNPYRDSYPGPYRYPDLDSYLADRPARLPRLRIDRAAIHNRYVAVLTRPREEFRAALVESICDVPGLLSEVDRLWLLLVATRRRYANLVAAGRATLAAHADGEDDPLSYLRDELPPNPDHGPAGGRWGRR